MDRAYWWVSQSYNFTLAIKQQTLWSLPIKGRAVPDRQLLLRMRPGDVVLHYANKYLRAVSVVREPWRPAPRPEGYRPHPGDGNDGWLVELEVQTTGLSLHFHDIAALIPAGAPGPLDKNGKPRRIYLTELSEAEALALLKSAAAPIPPVSGQEGLLGLPDSYWDDRDTDSEAITRIRAEQTQLRRHLLHGRIAAPCALCGRVMPDRLLIAAHIAPRRLLSDTERRDFTSVAMLTCVTGCDALFEWGYVVVDDDGLVTASRPAETEALRKAVSRLVGRRCTAHDERTSTRFEQHRHLHPSKVHGGAQ